MSQKPSIDQRMQDLRSEMKTLGINGFIVPDADMYYNEWVPDSEKRLAWLTDFTGSSGTAIVLDDKAAFFTDSRYTLQAKDEVSVNHFEHLNIRKGKDAPEDELRPRQKFLSENLEEGQVFGYDPRLMTVSDLESFEKDLEPFNITLKAVEYNPIDEIWTDQPKPPATPIKLFDDRIAGRDVKEKAAETVKYIDENSTGAFITMADSVAWLLNIRANDVEHVPVALSTAFIKDHGQIIWFIDPNRVPQNVKDHLGATVIIVHPDDMKSYFEKLKIQNTIDIDSAYCAQHFKELLEGCGHKTNYKQEPVYLPRACKTPAEQQAMREAHIRDGAAVVKFLKWIEENGPSGKVTELNVDEKLYEYRSLSDLFQETSFETIAGWADNGAVVHYCATPEKHKTIVPPGILLVDSGAQYSDGTTDITRTMAIGEPTAEQIDRNTRVLIGHINLAKHVFDQGKTGSDIDELARKSLDEIGENYGHGTGHGVGTYLSVHENSSQISPGLEREVHEGMILSNEPGFYKDHEYGIRIESLILVNKRDDGKLEFETITMAPIDKNLIDVNLLAEDPSKLEWLNDYHDKVYNTLSPLLDADHQAWLKKACAPIAAPTAAPKQAAGLQP